MQERLNLAELSKERIEISEEEYSNPKIFTNKKEIGSGEFGVACYYEYAGNSESVKSICAQVEDNEGVVHCWLVIKGIKNLSHEEVEALVNNRNTMTKEQVSHFKAQLQNEFEEEQKISDVILSKTEAPDASSCLYTPAKSAYVKKSDGTIEPIILAPLVSYHMGYDENGKFYCSSNNVEKFLEQLKLNVGKSFNPEEKIVETKEKRTEQVALATSQFFLNDPEILMAQLISSLLNSRSRFPVLHLDMALRNGLISGIQFKDDVITEIDTKLTDYGFARETDKNGLADEERVFLPMRELNSERLINQKHNLNQNAGIQDEKDIEKKKISATADLFSLRIGIFRAMTIYLGLPELRDLVYLKRPGEERQIFNQEFQRNPSQYSDQKLLEKYINNTKSSLLNPNIDEDTKLIALNFISSFEGYILGDIKSLDDDKKLLMKSFDDFFIRTLNFKMDKIKNKIKHGDVDSIRSFLISVNRLMTLPTSGGFSGIQKDIHDICKKLATYPLDKENITQERDKILQDIRELQVKLKKARHVRFDTQVEVRSYEVSEPPTEQYLEQAKEVRFDESDYGVPYPVPAYFAEAPSQPQGQQQPPPMPVSFETMIRAVTTTFGSPEQIAKTLHQGEGLVDIKRISNLTHYLQSHEGKTLPKSTIINLNEYAETISKNLKNFKVIVRDLQSLKKVYEDQKNPFTGEVDVSKEAKQMMAMIDKELAKAEDVILKLNQFRVALDQKPVNKDEMKNIRMWKKMQEAEKKFLKAEQGPTPPRKKHGHG